MARAGLEKKGLIWGPDGCASWARDSALTPTPLLLDDGRLRIYAGFRDAEGVSRIGYVDLDPANPRRILGFSRQPVLDVGEPGCFDDNGMILGDLVRLEEGLIRMHYVGFQKVARAKFLAFSGLAISEDGGEHFRRECQAPILDRHDEGLYIRAIHSVLRENGRWRIR